MRPGAAGPILRENVALRIGIDIGGTFTDLVALDEATGVVVDTKALSTPQDLLQGILRCVDQAGARLDDCRLAIHGTTIGINALLEHKGARTGLVIGTCRDTLLTRRSQVHVLPPLPR